MNTTQLDATATLLAQVLTFRQPADKAVSAFFQRHRQLGRQDRHEIAETVFAALRHLEKIRTALSNPATAPRRAALAALVLGRGISISAIADWCAADDVAWLTELKGRKAEFADQLATAAELPAWLIDCLHDNGWTDDAIRQYGRSMSQSAPLDVRVNTLKGKRDNILAQLTAEQLACTATPYSPWGIRFSGKPALNKHPLFLDGVVEVQDEGSQLLSLLTGVRRGQIAVDFCAGAGGKTLAMGAMMAGKGRLYAFDVAEKRLAKLKPRMVRAGLTHIHPQRIEHEHDARLDRLAGKVDCVLVDAPCSGLGTLRRNPDLKYRQNRERISALQQQQQSILCAAAKLVRAGGRLVYATCSVLPAENETQIDAFLQQHRDWQLTSVADLLREQKIPLDTGVYLRLNTATHQTDGFFAAVLTKTQPA